MTTNAMMTKPVITKPVMMNPLNTYARSAGILYLLITILAPFSMIYMPATLVVPGDAVATAQQLWAGEGLLRAAMASDALIVLLEIVLTAVLYGLLKPAGPILSLVAAFARLAMTVIQGINLVATAAVLLLISGASYLAVFETAQIQALSLLLFNLHAEVVLLWGLCFGLHLLILGYAIYRSGYLPRFIGLLLIVVAACYFTQSFGNILLPNDKGLFTTIGYLATIEIIFPLWLLIRGVRTTTAEPSGATVYA